MPLTIDRETILKYDVPGPRYTSYPTAPVWNESVTGETYANKLQDFGRNDKTLSLYIHIPFCQSMCTYCACNVLIRPHEDKYGHEYVHYLSKEIDLVARRIGTRKKIKQFHWGGGTPTFLTEEQIEWLFLLIQRNFDIDFDGEIAIEIDPRTIDASKVEKLKELGFNRISMGVQDFDELVQRAINRIQPYALVEEVNAWCRKLKFHSVNFDLIYGLPYQTPQTFKDTVEKVLRLRPDRVALYSFAYVPWLKKHQTKIFPENLPTNDQKLDIFLQARAQFLQAGYQAIAMDHFALKDDEMARAFNDGRLYRNFMGYTVKPADEYIGLGLTSIGFLENTFVQNHKILKDYFDALDMDKLPVERGIVLSRDDQIRQWAISGLMCHFEIDKEAFAGKFSAIFDEYFRKERAHIQKCCAEGLLKEEGPKILVTESGKIFIRNICMGFDWYLQQKDGPQKFSRTI